MNNKDVKKRDVLPFDEFLKAYDTAIKVVATKNGENPHPGAHAIKGEDLYVKGNANIYKAAGIPHNTELANVNDTINANSVSVQEKPHDGQDPNDKKVIPAGKPTKEDAKAAKEASALIGSAYSAVALEESMFIETWYDGGQKQLLGSDGTVVLKDDSGDVAINNALDKQTALLKNLLSIKPFLEDGDIVLKVVDNTKKVIKERTIKLKD